MNITRKPKSVRRCALAVLTCSSMLGGVGEAFAQSATPTNGIVDTPDIVVTANKRSERLQDVPISIQALATETLEQHQVTRFDDYVKLLPSVSYQSFGPGQSQLYFRGISSAGDRQHVGSLPTSGFYLDEIPLTTIGNNVDLHVYDIERVEALSGPQGTLFGASSLSGTLRVITSKPRTDKFEGGYDLQLNKYGAGTMGGVAEGFVNVPLSSNIALRLVGFYQHDGGYIDNVPGSRTYLRPHVAAAPTPADPNATAVVNSPLTVTNAPYVDDNFNTVDSYGGRAALKIDLNDRWTVTPAVIYQHQKANGTFLYDPRVGDLQVHDFGRDLNRDAWYQAALTIQGKIGNWDVVYAGGYFGRVVETTADYSYYTVAYDAIPGYTFFTTNNGATPLDPTQIYHSYDKYTKQSHEFRISSPQHGRLRVVAGLFYQRQSDFTLGDFIVAGLSRSDQQIQVPAAANPDDIYYTRIDRVDRDYAIFGEAAFDIRPNLTLTAGMRGFKANNTRYGFTGLYFSITCPAGTPLGCPNTNVRKVDTGETHKVNLTWKIDPERMVYATYSTGYRPGGAANRSSIRPYDPDTLSNYEIGWKTSWFGRKLRWNGAVFLEDWHKLQYGLAPVGSLGVSYIYNAGNARVKGIESDINWLVGRHLTLSASGTYIDARLTTDFCNLDTSNNILPSCSVAAGNIAAPKGTRLPIQPKVKLNAGARYGFALGRGDAFVQGTLYYQSGTRSYLSDRDASLLGPTDGFASADFSAGFSTGKLRFELFLQNAFDTRGALSKNTVCTPDLCAAYARIYPIKPRFFGLKVGQRF